MALACAVGLLTGCGESQTESASSPQATDAPAAPPLPPGDGRKPAEVVRLFLEAMQRGDPAGVDAMITATARKLDLLQVQPREGHRFSVGDVEMVGEKGARVASAWYYTWTTPEGDAKDETEKLIWILRREDEGYRICGTVAVVPELGEAVSLDIEDAKQFHETQEAVREKMLALARQENSASVAEKPRETRPAQPR